MSEKLNDGLVSPASTLDRAPLLEEAFQRRANPQTVDSPVSVNVAPAVPSGFDIPNENQPPPAPSLKGP